MAVICPWSEGTGMEPGPCHALLSAHCAFLVSINGSQVRGLYL